MMDLKPRYLLTLGAILLAPGLNVSNAFPADNGDPKCVFLKEQLARLESIPAPIPDRVAAAIRPSYARYLKEVQSNIARGKITSCEKKERLSTLSRLHDLEAMRDQHVNKIRGEVDGAAADVLVEAVNGAYEDEARSFYNYETAKAAVIDRDVPKDFPALPELVKESALPDGLKASIAQHYLYIKYEEAGRLQNALQRVDKDLGTTMAYVLRSDLANRADADAAQRKAAEAQSKQRLIETEAREKINARITISLSLLTVVALICYMLIRRELTNWQMFMNAMIIAGLLGAGWILAGMGFFDFILEYMSLAV